MLMRKFNSNALRWAECRVLVFAAAAAAFAAPLWGISAEDAALPESVAADECYPAGEAPEDAALAMDECALNAGESVDVAQVSEAFGHLIVSNLDNPGFHFDFDAIMKGMRDAIDGQPSPMSEEQYEKAITAIQEKIFSEMAVKNLNEANGFMDQNACEGGIVCLEDGKLQYRVTQEGEGREVPQDGTPLINYTGRYLDGTVFGSSLDNGSPITLPLDRTIPGFRLGIVGMKEGEKRTLYIHPDLGYGMSGHLPPNSLLVFDIELLEANRDMASAEEPTTVSASHAAAAESVR